MSPPPPHGIPTDVLYDVLLQYGAQNLSFLWLNCRAVSRNFKDAVEHVFVTKHLKKTWLHVGVDMHDAYIKLQFDHLDSTDSSRAVFESSECQGLERELGNGLSLEHPNVIIQVRHDVNDTMLPDFRYHLDPDLDVKFEISFDWERMYCHFFREQKEVQTRLDERQQFIMTQSPFWVFYMSCSMFLGVDECRISRDVRTERIRRNVLENEGREVSGDDKSGFHKLENRKRLAVREYPYSDESDDDEDSETDVSEEDTRSEDDEGADDSDESDEDEDSETDVPEEDSRSEDDEGADDSDESDEDEDSEPDVSQGDRLEDDEGADESDESDEDGDSEPDVSQGNRPEDDEVADDSDEEDEDEDEDSEVDVSSEEDDEHGSDFDSDE